MGFPEETAQAIRGLDEHWDGRGHPDGLAGEEIPLLARICGLGQTVEVFLTECGPAAAEEVARVRSGRWFDPALVEVLLAEAREGGLWEDLSREDPWREVSRLEPDDRALKATPERVDLVAGAFAEIIDAKSPFTYRHSEGVARVAVAIAESAGLGPEDIRDLMRAALLHDIGKLGVSNPILGQARQTHRPGVRGDQASPEAHLRHPLPRGALQAHRRDGREPPREARRLRLPPRLGAEDLDLPSRILAVADIYDALSANRPYHEAMPQEKVLGIMREESSTKIDPGCVAILEDLAAENKV